MMTKTYQKKLDCTNRKTSGISWAVACLSRMMSLATRANGQKSGTAVLPRLTCGLVLFSVIASPAALGEPLTGPFPITFDATALDTVNFNLDFSSTLGGPNVVTTLLLQPGNHNFHAPASHQSAIIPITVTSVGTIDFDPIFDSIASGRGTDTLTVTGLPITVDATALDTSDFNVDFSAAGGGANVVTTLRLLPGDYSIRSPASHQTAIIPITVTPTGTIVFDPLFDSIASGRDTDTLMVTGLPFTFDATALDVVNFNLDFSFTAGGPNVVTTLRMLPGDYKFQAPASSSTAFIPITLLFDGTIEFDSFFDSVASGRETDTLVATGVTIGIAAASSGDATYTLGSGVGTFLTADCQVLQLLPGVYGFNSVSAAFLLEITQLGTFDYDPALDTLIAGRGTDTLAFRDENGIPDSCDTDGDGVPDDADCQPDSDVSETVVIDGCDSGVTNVPLDNGCTILDLIWFCADDANNHGQFVSCVAQLTNDLQQQGIISGQEKGAIQSCAAQADIP